MKYGSVSPTNIIDSECLSLIYEADPAQVFCGILLTAQLKK